MNEFPKLNYAHFPKLKLHNRLSQLKIQYLVLTLGYHFRIVNEQLVRTQTRKLGHNDDFI